MKKNNPGSSSKPVAESQINPGISSSSPVSVDNMPSPVTSDAIKDTLIQDSCLNVLTI